MNERPPFPDMAQSSTYLDKVFRQPEYIWEEGSAKTSLIASSIEGGQVQRLGWLANTNTGNESHDPISTAPSPLPIPQAGIQPSPAPGVSLDGNKPSVSQGPARPGATRNSVVPLLSLVWNNAEPQNYVHLISSAMIEANASSKHNSGLGLTRSHFCSTSTPGHRFCGFKPAWKIMIRPFPTRISMIPSARRPHRTN